MTYYLAYQTSPRCSAIHLVPAGYVPSAPSAHTACGLRLAWWVGCQTTRYAPTCRSCLRSREWREIEAREEAR